MPDAVIEAVSRHHPAAAVHDVAMDDRCCVQAQIGRVVLRPDGITVPLRWHSTLAEEVFPAVVDAELRATPARWDESCLELAASFAAPAAADAEALGKVVEAAADAYLIGVAATI